jgi:hypothetical protein
MIMTVMFDSPKVGLEFSWLPLCGVGTENPRGPSSKPRGPRASLPRTTLHGGCDGADGLDNEGFAEGFVRTGQSSGFVGHATPRRRPATFSAKMCAQMCAQAMPSGASFCNRPEAPCLPDMCSAPAHVCFGPISDIDFRLFDHRNGRGGLLAVTPHGMPAPPVVVEEPEVRLHGDHSFCRVSHKRATASAGVLAKPR